jgi:dienelactone hydrolase
MSRLSTFVSPSVALLLTFVALWSQSSSGSETVVIHSGAATLRATLWRPTGRGPFPAVLLNHGSGRTAEDLQRLGSYEQNAAKLGPVFARNGYVLLYLYRRGVGSSKGREIDAAELMSSAAAAQGEQARNALQLELLDGREMVDARSALVYLRDRPEVDAANVALIGHSFGGSLSLLMAERDPAIRAVVVFSAAGYSFDRSSDLRARLLTAADHIEAPIFCIHAANDYSLSSGKVLDARREHAGKPHRLKIYPSAGSTVESGHDFLYGGISIWEPDVFAFLDGLLKTRPNGRAAHLQ